MTTPLLGILLINCYGWDYLLAGYLKRILSSGMSEEQPEKKQKRAYRKGNPLSGTEYTQRYRARKYKDGKEFSAIIPASLKDEVAAWCKKNKTTQTSLVVTLFENHLKKYCSKS